MKPEPTARPPPPRPDGTQGRRRASRGVLGLCQPPANVVIKSGARRRQPFCFLAVFSAPNSIKRPPEEVRRRGSFYSFSKSRARRPRRAHYSSFSAFSSFFAFLFFACSFRLRARKARAAFSKLFTMIYFFDFNKMKRPIKS